MLFEEEESFEKTEDMRYNKPYLRCPLKHAIS